jgi:hypothetical protein
MEESSLFDFLMKGGASKLPGKRPIPPKFKPTPPKWRATPSRNRLTRKATKKATPKRSPTPKKSTTPAKKSTTPAKKSTTPPRTKMTTPKKRTPTATATPTEDTPERDFAGEEIVARLKSEYEKLKSAAMMISDPASWDTFS